MKLDASTHIGDYALVEPLSQGGMGQLFLAHHARFGEVVLKTVRAVKRTTLESIRAEICALAELEQPGIVRILEHGIHRGIPWYTMELIEGLSLRALMRDQAEGTAPRTQATERMTSAHVLSLASRPRSSAIPPATQVDLADVAHIITRRTRPSRRPASGAFTPLIIPDDDAEVSPRFIERFGSTLGVFQGLCHALSHLHSAGFVHCDLKPDNIMISGSGQATLVDFGLAAFVGGGGGHETLTVPQRPAGSLAYMAPEQFEHGWIDARADVYALGCVLYEILTGQPPFRAKTIAEYQTRHLHATPAPPSSHAEDIPPRLDALVLHMLAKHPADRPSYVSDIAEAITPWVEPAPPPRAAPRPYLFRPGFSGRHVLRNVLRDAILRLKQPPEPDTLRSRLILIQGSSGMGKTRLGLELAHEGIRRDVTTICPDPLPDEFPELGPIHNAARHFNYIWQERGSAVDVPLRLREAARVIATYDASLMHIDGIRELPEPEPLPLREHMHRLFDAIFTIFCHHAQQDPVLLLLDDLHDSDRSTLAFLRYVTRDPRFQDPTHPHHAPILIVGFHADDAHIPEGLLHLRSLAEQHTLEPLERIDVHLMVCSMLAMLTPPESLIEHAYQRSQGQPSEVAAALHEAIEDGSLTRNRRGRWRFQA